MLPPKVSKEMCNDVDLDGHAEGISPSGAVAKSCSSPRCFTCVEMVRTLSEVD